MKKRLPTVMTKDSPEIPLRIVIVGGGLVGLFAAITLSKLPNAVVSVYEKSDSAREAGAAISLVPSSLITLNRVLDIDEIQPLLYRSPGGNPTSRLHWKTGKSLGEITGYKSVVPKKFSHSKALRVSLLEFFLKHVPEGVLHYNHQFVDYSVSSDGVDVNFSNGVTVEADLLVAADGIYSKIRKQVTHDKATYKGAVAYRNVFDAKIVNDIPGVPDDVTVWIGKGQAMFMTRLEPGLFNVAAHLPDPPEVADTLRWNHSTGEWGTQRLKDHFKDWDPLIGKILDVMPEAYAFPTERTPWLKNLTRDDRIAFVGDAAHPTSGVYGAGAAFGFDDVWALYRGLLETRSYGYNLAESLTLFNETRIGFLQRVEKQIDIDKLVGQEYISQAKDDEEWTTRVAGDGFIRLWISEHNTETEFQQVRDKYFLDIHNKKSASVQAQLERLTLE